MSLLDLISSLLVGKPLNILVVAIVFAGLHAVGKFSGTGKARRVRPSAVAAWVWALYALWVWAVLVATPEANIRVDLLLIWPVLAVLSLWALFQWLR